MQIVKLLMASIICFAFNAISQNVITEIPSNGIVISSPGTYVLAKNIKWYPNGDGQAILIAANDVILDLRNHTLKSKKTQFDTTGILASGVQVIECSVKNITAINPQDKQSTGFSCAQCEGVIFIGCRAENVNVYNEDGEHYPELGYGTGFGWAPDPRPPFLAPATDTRITDCTAKCCQVGFDTFNQINAVYDNICSDCNEIPILDLPNSQRTISCNPCSECVPPKVVTITNAAKNNTFLNVCVIDC